MPQNKQDQKENQNRIWNERIAQGENEITKRDAFFDDETQKKDIEEYNREQVESTGKEKLYNNTSTDRAENEKRLAEKLEQLSEGGVEQREVATDVRDLSPSEHVKFELKAIGQKRYAGLEKAVRNIEAVKKDQSAWELTEVRAALVRKIHNDWKQKYNAN